MTETISSSKDLCRTFMKNNIPVMIEGPPGVGKSEMWKQIAAEEKIGFIDVRLAQLDPVDLRGLPTVKDNISSWARPDFWPDVKRDGEKGIILFDELPDCGRAMQSAAYQIILDGRAGPHVIPASWYRAGAGNRRQDKAAAQAVSTALASRFAWIEVAADADCFRKHGIKMGYHHNVLGFIKMRPTFIHNMEGSDGRSFPCPRQWERVSRIMGDVTPENRFRMVKALIGEGAAGEFEAFMKVLDLPELEEILADPKKCRIPENPSSKYALSSMLATNAKRDNFEQVLTYMKRTEFGRDFEVCAVLDACQRDCSLCETKAYVEFANRNKDLKV